MILSFRHRGLKRLYEQGDPSKLPPGSINRIENILARLDAAKSPQGMDVPAYRLHRLTGDMKNFWSVRVTGITGLSSVSKTEQPTTLTY